MRQGLASSTIFSLAADFPAAEPLALGHADLDAATLTGERIALPCSLRKLNAAGATLHHDAALTEGDALSLTLASGQSIPGTIAWTTGETAGFVFDAPIDVVGTVARTLASLPAERRQMPRIELHQTVSVHHKGAIEFTRSRNLSQGGASVESRRLLLPEDPVQISFDGLRPIDGTIKWASDGQAGIEFDEPLPWQILMPWLRQVQQTPAHPIRSGAFPVPGLIPDAHAIQLDAPARVREGVRWWNVRLRGLTSQLVEFESRAPLTQGTPLWIALPHIGGAPASVLETDQHRYLCEFRLPLRPGELSLISSGA
ncbi:MAG: PilZ domain-containing protein [Sphingomonas sp.]|uniref:PilZ domain-containing protein n=1 Tax=Sphingomonas sp. TaxID=28214 RepID=UPI0025FA2F05|nr:PilZ domain-containing protein [Sphingomonas sp.]MBX3564885.1 PilZ domain-containing protein [Sphingomonas sp.]